MARRSKKKKGGGRPEKFDVPMERVESKISAEDLENFEKLVNYKGISRSDLIREAMIHYVECQNLGMDESEKDMSILKQKEEKEPPLTAFKVVEFAEKVISEAWNEGLLIDKEIHFDDGKVKYESLKQFLWELKIMSGVEQKNFRTKPGFKRTKDVDIDELRKNVIIKLKKYILAEKEIFEKNPKYTKLMLMMNNYLDPEPPETKPVLNL